MATAAASLLCSDIKTLVIKETEGVVPSMCAIRKQKNIVETCVSGMSVANVLQMAILLVHNYLATIGRLGPVPR
jgi:hypothetical protein